MSAWRFLTRISRGSRATYAHFTSRQPPLSQGFFSYAVALGSSAAVAGGVLAWRYKSGSISCDEKSPSRVNVTNLVHVEGMMCNGCRGRVESALAAVAGVESVSVELESKLARVSGFASSDDLIAAITATGKKAELVATVGSRGFKAMTVAELKTSLAMSGQHGIVLDIDETLSATNVAWFTRLAELFGNDEGESIQALVKKYHLAQNVPFWQSEEAHAWMQRQRDDPKAQDGLPVIPGALEGVHALAKVVPILGYCTVRPTSVNANTITWLKKLGFPDLPVVAKPEEVPFADGNKWKAESLHALWPQVTGIVDDNPKVPTFAGKDYPGIIFLFGHSTTKPAYEHAIPCTSWPAVVATAVKFKHRC